MKSKSPKNSHKAKQAKSAGNGGGPNFPTGKWTQWIEPKGAALLSQMFGARLLRRQESRLEQRHVDGSIRRSNGAVSGRGACNVCPRHDQRREQGREPGADRVRVLADLPQTLTAEVVQLRSN
jgi:hypothetical protein